MIPCMRLVNSKLFSWWKKLFNFYNFVFHGPPTQAPQSEKCLLVESEICILCPRRVFREPAELVTIFQYQNIPQPAMAPASSLSHLASIQHLNSNSLFLHKSEKAKADLSDV